MRILSFAKGIAAPAVMATVLAGCTVAEGQPPPPRPGPDRPVMCTQEYDPVCAVGRGERQTFGNACLARAEGYRIVSRGECRSGRPDRPPPRERACTREYAPVCARRGGDVRTFGNACEAESARYRVVRRGQC